MRIPEILSTDRILCRAEITSKKSALETLSKLMASSEPSLTYTEIFDCLNARERLGSTGIGNGIAIPHGRFQHIKQPVAAFLQLKSGIDFDAVDQKPVDLLFSLLVPADSTDEHLQILSCLAAMFSDAALINRLRLRSSPEKIYEILTK
jgi:PTS system nitrogen regulatory IIA component